MAAVTGVSDIGGSADLSFRSSGNTAAAAPIAAACAGLEPRRYGSLAISACDLQSAKR
jgi:hypothetical protein